MPLEIKDLSLLCVYGCENLAKYMLFAHGGIEKPCCSPHYQQCPGQKRRDPNRAYFVQKRVNPPRVLDLRKITFGRWHVIGVSHQNERLEWFLRVRCECGNERIIGKTTLLNGGSKSCGCLKTELATGPMLGRRFGRLTVVEQRESKKYPSGSKPSRWLCRCDCGRTKVVGGQGLRTGAIKSCGCLNDESRRRGKAPGDSLRRALLYRYRKEALRKGLPWMITNELFASLLRGICYYCGCGPSQTLKLGGKDELTYNGIDRLDNKEGYHAKNCVSCCKVCNWMKSNLSLTDFHAHLKRILARHPNSILHPSLDPVASQGRIPIYLIQS